MAAELKLGRGFTLLEILIVVVIVGVLAGIAMLSVGLASGASATEREASRLTRVIGLTADHAIVSGAPAVLRFTRRGYGLVDDVRGVRAERLLRRHELTAGVELRVGDPLPADISGGVELRFMPDGRSQQAVFELRETNTAAGVRLGLDPFGQVRLVRQEGPS